jgi:hypothetical protein
MKFLITATHNYETCPVHNEDVRKSFVSVIKSAPEHNIKVESVLTNAPDHVIYIIIEAEALTDINAMLDPILTHNHYDIEPVLDLGAALASTNN